MIRVMLVVVAATLVYLLPGAIAAKRNHRQFNAIFALNILLGWTFIGWVIALVWALMQERAAAPNS